MFVADGHHRYETACNYRDQLTEESGPLPDDHPEKTLDSLLDVVGNAIRHERVRRMRDDMRRETELLGRLEQGG